jgi:lipid-A-disaccharide synthase
MRSRWPRLPRRASAGRRWPRGFQAWWPHEKLAVRGYVEVLRHYRRSSASATSCSERLLREAAAGFIGVDAPDFNLDLEARSRQRASRPCTSSAPPIWAWRAGRVEKIRRAADHVLCIFPFEPDCCANMASRRPTSGIRWPT